LRKQISDTDEDIMAQKLVDELDTSGWEVRKKPGGHAGFTFEPPEGPG